MALVNFTISQDFSYVASAAVATGFLGIVRVSTLPAETALLCRSGLFDDYTDMFARKVARNRRF